MPGVDNWANEIKSGGHDEERTRFFDAHDVVGSWSTSEGKGKGKV
jgi:hypothetical protein